MNCCNGGWDRVQGKIVVFLTIAGMGLQSALAGLMPPGLSKTRQLLDAKVKTTDRVDAGQIKDLLVDLTAGRIAYVILALPGNSEYSAVAPDFFSRSDAAGVALKVNQDLFQRAPRFAKEQWPAIAKDRRERLYHYYRIEPHPPEISSGSAGRLDMIGYGRLTPASELLGMKVSDYHSERLGNLEELVLNLERGEISYAVVGLPSHSSAIPKLVVVPAFLFQTHTDGKMLVLNTTPQRLAAAPRINEKSWPEVAAPAWGAMRTQP